MTNKAEALRKFLARKKMTNLTDEQKKVVELAMRKNKEDTVFVKDFKKMRKDKTPNDVESLLKESSKKVVRNNNNKNRKDNNKKRKRKNKKGNRDSPRQERKQKPKKKRKNNNNERKKKKRSDSFSLLNGALTSRR